MFEYSIRDFFEPQNNAEQCCFSVFFTQFREAFECQKMNSGCSCALHVDFRPSDFEHSIRDFLETQTVEDSFLIGQLGLVMVFFGLFAAKRGVIWLILAVAMENVLCSSHVNVGKG